MIADHLLVCVFFILSFILRLHTLTLAYPAYEGDVATDYLLANHIVLYQEIGLVGPFNTILTSIPTAPLYLHVLAFFLTIKNHILFLGVINIILQLFASIALYVLAKNLFTKTTAYLTAFFLAFHPVFTEFASHMWRPHVVHLFIITSYLALWLAQKLKHYYYLLLSNLLFVFSVGIGFYPLTITPLYLVSVLYVLHNQRKSLKYYFVAFFFFSSTILFLYSSVLFSLSKSKLSSISPDSIYVQGLDQFIKQFISTTQSVLQALFWLKTTEYLDFIGLASFILFLVYYLISKITTKRKILILYILFFCFQPIFLASLLKFPIPIYDFTPIIGLLTIIYSESFLHFLKVLPKLIKNAILFSYLLIFSINWFTNISAWRQFRSEERAAYENATSMVLHQIAKINLQEKKETFDYFSIFDLEETHHGSHLYQDMIFWAILEKKFAQKLVRIDMMSGLQSSEGKNKYIFLVCMKPKFPEGQSTIDCIDYFGRQFPKHQIIQTIFSEGQYSIYLWKNNNI